jgi:flagellar biosynthesis/type III secretory pathway M-ring protein FliF/YscJ
MKAFLPIAFIALAALTLLVSIAFVWRALRVLFGGEAQSDLAQSEAMRRRAELLDEKDAVLRSLKDLEFEKQVGKISDDDFKRLDAEFRTRARRILKLLDDDLKEHRDKARALVQKEIAGAEKSA